MAFERACALDEVRTDQALAVTIGRYDIAIARNGDEVFAIEDTCSHAEVALSEGEVAESIDTYEENRNLVLTDGCRADSIPNLEIETGEIEGAGHASATARFDDEQLFYLRSRGIDDKEARRLVVHGFFNDLIRKIGVPSIEERLLATVEAELAKNVLKELF